MNINSLKIIAKIMYVTGVTILILSAAILMMGPVVLMLGLLYGGKWLLAVPLLGIALVIAGKAMAKKYNAAHPAPEIITERYKDDFKKVDTAVNGSTLSTASIYPTPIQSQTQSISPNISATPTNPSKKTSYIKRALIITPVLVVVLLYSFAPLHRLNTYRKLNNVDLPLSNLGASISSNAIMVEGTAVTFTVNKNYASAIEAKKDIIKKLGEAGITILRDDAEPGHISFPDGTESKEGNETISSYAKMEMSFIKEYHIFVFDLASPVICTSGSQNNTSTHSESLCESRPAGSALSNTIANNRPVSAVHVYATVYY